MAHENRTPSSPLDAFLEAFWEDMEADAVRPLAEYLARFPGDDAAITGQYCAFREAGARAMGGTTAGATSSDHIGPYHLIREIGRGADTSCVHLSEIESAGEAPPRGGTDPTPTPSGPTTRAAIMRVVHLIEKVARALHAAHEKGVIHRDVKPGNVMITPEGEAVVMDFGLAHLEDDDQPTVTRTGDFFGTPAYMSPEQLLAQQVRLDCRTDVWSLGVMLYECVTLRRPFEGPTREGLYLAIQTRQPQDPRRINRSVPDELRVVIECALAKNWDDRYQTALELAEEETRSTNLGVRPARAVDHD